MSRRAPADNRVEANRATLKSLVKLESNKSCADCKKNKHPRWASWNLGIFVCIRCSGIHRGMGTHISRVKSVDLDSWTDEQTQSMLNWGNARANKYWEAKLAEGHVPSESKIENFIRTKYDSKRWVMDGPMPDPSTLDGDDIAAPAQPAAPVERASSQRQPVTRQQPKASLDLFGDDISAPARPSTGPPVGTQPPPKAVAAPAKQSKPAESLLGLDFFGSSPAPPARPSSDLGTSSKSAGSSKADLKQSILSLYASAPKPAPPQNQPSAFNSFATPSQSPPPQQQSSGFGGLDAFSSLNMGSSTSSTPQPQIKASAFSDLANLSNTNSKPTHSAAPSFGAGGSFFDSAPKSPSMTQSAAPAKPAAGGFADLFSNPSQPAQNKSSSSNMPSDLFDFSSTAPSSNLSSQSITLSSNSSKPAPSPSTNISSAFNLSSTSRSAQSSQPAAPVVSSGFAGMDPWGASDVWGAPDPTPAPASTMKSESLDNGWGSSATTKSTKPAETTITGDEDFGGWNSAPAIQPSATTPSASKPSGGGFGGNNDDLFGNVWN